MFLVLRFCLPTSHWKVIIHVCDISSPLPQVPGISRTEASALYQSGFLNAKNLVSAPPDKLATALRMNVPFRIRRGAENKGALGRPKCRREPFVSQRNVFDHTQ